MLIGVCVILVAPEGQVLLGRRTYPGKADCWCLPGGKVDAGESFEAAAARETAEECGIVLNPPPRPAALLLDTFEGAPRVTAICVVPLEEAREARVMEPAKLPEWRWFPPDALPSPLFQATDAAIAGWRRGWRDEAAGGGVVYPLASAN